MSIKEHDCVVLTVDVPKEGLKAGDVRARSFTSTGEASRTKWSS